MGGSNLEVTNEEFLQAIFGDKYKSVHVTSFMDDPSNITHGESGRCWAGGHFGNTPLIQGSNQYWTVSLFDDDEQGKVNRRQANFSACYVAGLDDVREKMPVEQVMRLPPPSAVVKTSLGSEQWLYILDTPETNPSRIDNLHDGLIASDLVPSGKDTGMKGTTRYLRLPEGCNTKNSRIAENGGVAPRCEITEWHPERRYTLEQIAAPFGVDIDAPRADKRTSGAVEIPDHPLLHTRALNVKRQRGGKVEINCPWVGEHTGRDDSGAAMFTNSDDIGFKCHHGNCEGRTATDLLDYIEEQDTGFKERLKSWQAEQAFSVVSPVDAGVAPPSVAGVASGKPVSVLDRLDAMVVDGDEMLKRIGDETYVMKDMAIRGQWTVLFASPNGGKTLLTQWLLREAIASGEVDGSRVYYLNMDDSGSSGALKAKMAKEYGYKMLVLSENHFRVKDVIGLIEDAVATGEASNVVFVVDTQKKLTDPMDKKLSREFGVVAREFVSAGGTLICLAHTNKHKGADGKSVPEGTSDIMNDADCAYVIEHMGTEKGFDGVEKVTVEFNNRKMRGDNINQQSFQYTKQRGAGYRAMFDSVRRLDTGEAKCVVAAVEAAEQQRIDAQAIEAIRAALENGMTNKTAITEFAMKTSEHVSQHRCRQVLERHEGSLWKATKGENNATIYSLNLPPDPPVTFM